jgi:hypothetical protein
MSIRFVRPETTILHLTGGDSLVVRKRLTNGEARKQFARAYEVNPDGRLRVNLIETGMALVTAYLIDWTQHDDATAASIRGLTVDELTDVLNQLDPASFSEIKEAIEQHELAMLAEREAEKNSLAGGTTASAILPLPSDADGVLIGSAT